MRSMTGCFMPKPAARAGIEFGLVENLSGKIEYDFYGFGTKNHNFGFTPVSVRSNLHTLIVGLNYRFNWSGGPKP
jgi:outer membrane immunogenic protein